MTRVLIAGLGNMGLSHALAHHKHSDSEIVGLVNRSGRVDHVDLKGYPVFTNFQAALETAKPDLVVIATYSDSHADYAISAMKAGAHVFVEKPLATTVEDARRDGDVDGVDAALAWVREHHPIEG